MFPNLFHLPWTTRKQNENQSLTIVNRVLLFVNHRETRRYWTNFGEERVTGFTHPPNISDKLRTTVNAITLQASIPTVQMLVQNYVRAEVDIFIRRTLKNVYETTGHGRILLIITIKRVEFVKTLSFFFI